MYVVVFAFIILLLYYETTKKFDYWKKKNVPYSRPLPFFGNYLKFILMQKCSGEVSQQLCRQFRKEPYFGSYYGTEPALVILDPEIIKLVFTKDFYYFNSRELLHYSNKETIIQNVFHQHGDKWKVLRTNLTPLFSSAKLRNMFYLIEKCAHTFEDMLDYETGVSNVVEARTLMIRYTMDCICSCAFGITTKTMEKDSENNPFTVMGRELFGSSYLQGFYNYARQIWPHLFYAVGLKAFSKSVDNFFYNLITGVFKSRNYTPSQRHDFVDLLLNLKKQGTISADSMNGSGQRVQLEVDDVLMVAQCVIFFGAGFETSAAAVSLTIHELAKNQPAQRRAQEEIDAYLKHNNNKLSDDCVTELPFLEACVSETLRLYPVIPVLTREVVQDYTFPSGLHVEKGMRVHLPVYHLHRDPERFPDPEEYKPERFLPGAEHEIKPYTFFPFGEGPRTCIGMRFSKLQVLPGLITFLKKFSVTLVEGTSPKLEYQPTSFVLQPASLLPVQVVRRPGWETRVYAR